MQHIQASGNTATHSGGFVHTILANRLLVEHAVLTQNTAVEFGGGIFVTSTTVGFHKVEFIENKVLNGLASGSGGGGLFASDGAELHMSEVVLTGNQALSNSGGHVSVVSSKLIVHDLNSILIWPALAPTFVNEKVLTTSKGTKMKLGKAKRGGSIAVSSAQAPKRELSVDKSILCSHDVYSYKYKAADAAFVYLCVGNGVYIGEGSLITESEATGDRGGGAVHAVMSDVYVTGAGITSSKASGDWGIGGAVALELDATLEITAGSSSGFSYLKHNQASMHGGAVACLKCLRLTLHGTF